MPCRCLLKLMIEDFFLCWCGFTAKILMTRGITRCQRVISNAKRGRYCTHRVDITGHIDSECSPSLSSHRPDIHCRPIIDWATGDHSAGISATYFMLIKQRPGRNISNLCAYRHEVCLRGPAMHFVMVSAAIYDAVGALISLACPLGNEAALAR